VLQIFFGKLEGFASQLGLSPDPSAHYRQKRRV